MNKFSWLEMFKELNKGKSLARTLLNLHLKDVKLSGRVLDLGSKSNQGSYNRFLQKESGCQIDYTDLYGNSAGVLKLNLEEKFPIADGQYDFITCFNTLEHIYNYKNAVSESFRILKSGGLFIGQTPFLVNFHADPNDYWRYTHQSVEKIFKEVGFRVEKIIFLGYGPLTASFALCAHLYPKFLRSIFIFWNILLDKIILKIKSNQRDIYPLGYLYIMKK